MIFVDKNYLFLLLILPFLIFVFSVFYKNRKKDLAKFASEKNLNVLTQTDEKSWIKKYILITIGFFFLILALARPQFGDTKEEIVQESSEIIVALDVSKSMLARDVSPNRIERAKLMLSNLIDANAGNKMGIIIFSGMAMWQCPLTYDLEALKMFLQDISVEQLPVGGTQISGAVMLAASAAKLAPGSNKVLILVSDGEDHDSKIGEAIKAAKESGLKIISVGIGSQTGAPIPENGSYIKDNQGKTVFTKLSPAALKTAANETGGEYFEAGLKDISSDLISASGNIEKNENGKITRNSKADRFQIFLLLSLLSFFAALLVLPSNKIK
ncbi:MAG: VWA domain-containing protein [Elusimicrobiota bacterium]|jgi:Ca-activated chloride channel family protein|nr:VWA domain-containing protein [Elusimicrobiota bacterium]